MVIQPAFVPPNPLAPAGDVARAENQGFEIGLHFRPENVECAIVIQPRPAAFFYNLSCA
jgi:hypothetical protein